MANQLQRVVAGVIPVQRFQRLCDPGVHSDSACRRKLLRQGFLDQGMGEFVPADAIGKLVDDPRCESLIEHIKKSFLRRVIRKNFHLVERELTTYDRGDCQHLVTSFRQFVEATPDDFAHSLGNPDVP